MCRLGRDCMVVGNQYLSPLKLCVRIPLRRGVLNTTLCDKVYQWLVAGQWFSVSTVTVKLKNSLSLTSCLLIIPSPTKLRRDIVTLPSIRPSFLPSVRPSVRHILVKTRINILQWILTKRGTCLVLRRVWNHIDFQGQRSRSPGQIFTA